MNTLSREKQIEIIAASPKAWASAQPARTAKRSALLRYASVAAAPDSG
jgi:hypothetical protein